MAKDKTVKIPTDGSCPWCNYDNSDETQGPLHDAVDSKLDVTVNGQLQCGTCGKIWSKDAVGKPYTIALERGPAWEREHKARQLNNA